MNVSMPAGSLADGRPRRARRDWLWLIPAGAILVLLRLHALDLPLETDECNYAYIGARLLDGERLYVDVWDHQPPGVFMLFAGVIALLGDAPEVFRGMATAFSLGSLVLVFAIARRIGGLTAGVVAALLFALASSDPGTAGEGCNREIYMNTLILAAWYLALRSCTGLLNGAGRSPLTGLTGCARDENESDGPGRPNKDDAGESEDRLSPWLIFGSGVALGLGSLIKTVVAVHWILLAVWIVWIAWSRAPRPVRAKRAGTVFLLFSAGPVSIWLATFVWFGSTGRLSDFIDAVFLFNLSYSGAGEAPARRLVDFFSPPRHPFIFDSALPLWIGGLVAAMHVALRVIRFRDRGASATLALLIAAYVAICLPGRFWPHYYYLLIPPLAVAASLTASSLAGWIRRRTHHSSAVRYALAGLILIVLPAALAVTQYRHYISQPLFGITVKRYNSRDFWGRAQGRNVQQVTDAGDEIFVYGNDTQIYYYARRRCASSFTMITGIQSGYEGSDRRRRRMIEELTRRLPRVIIVLFDEKPFPEWHQLLRRYYGEAVGVDYHDRTRKPIMLVFARKDQPIESIDWDWDRSSVGGWMLGARPE